VCDDLVTVIITASRGRVMRPADVTCLGPERRSASSTLELKLGDA
jgi:hypothetical protein